MIIQLAYDADEKHPSPGEPSPESLKKYRSVFQKINKLTPPALHMEVVHG